MYRFIHFSLTLILIVLSSCQEKNVPGLVLHYPFDSDALDQSGNGNDGVVHGATLTEDRYAEEKSAYYFNGSSSYIHASVKNMPAVESPQTISLWFMIQSPPAYSDSMGANNMIALVDTSKGIGVQFGYRAPAYGTLGLDTWYWGGRSVLESQQPPVNEWHHSVYAFDGQKHFFYLDGQQTAQSSVKPQVGTPHMLMLGNYPGGDQYFKGALDEVLIFNRVLSASEIELLYSKKE